MNIRSLQDAKDYIEENRLTLDAQSSYSLSRAKKLLDKLDNPQDKIKIVHVAGTSGKTSTCYYLAKLLQLNGYKTGLTISPHLEEINERIQLDLTPLPEKEFCKNFDEFIQTIEPYKIKPTYFELFVTFAFWYFAKIEVDYAVVEVGIGGLLDATNTVNREDKICVITDIGLDHMDILGGTIEEIAEQKTGIIQPANKVFCNQQKKPVMNVIRRRVERQQAKLTINSEEEFDSFAERNFSLAKLVATKIFEGDKKSQLKKTHLDEAASITVPGRMEKYEFKDKTVILDGAHNFQKVENLLKSLDGANSKDCCFVLALGENKKDHLLKISQSISKFASHVILTNFAAQQDFERKSLSPGYLKSYFENTDVEKVFDLNKAIETALSRPEKTIIFTGSLYMVGPVRTKLKGLLSESRS